MQLTYIFPEQMRSAMDEPSQCSYLFNETHDHRPPRRLIDIETLKFRSGFTKKLHSTADFPKMEKVTPYKNLIRTEIVVIGEDKCKDHREGENLKSSCPGVSFHLAFGLLFSSRS